MSTEPCVRNFPIPAPLTPAAETAVLAAVEAAWAVAGSTCPAPKWEGWPAAYVPEPAPKEGTPLAVEPSYALLVRGGVLLYRRWAFSHRPYPTPPPLEIPIDLRPLVPQSLCAFFYATGIDGYPGSLTPLVGLPSEVVTREQMLALLEAADAATDGGAA